jgi:hypothetical protein
MLLPIGQSFDVLVDAWIGGKGNLIMCDDAFPMTFFGN